MKKSGIAVLLLNSLCSSYSQHPDTTRPNPLRADIKQSHWCVGVNTGIQKRFHAGLSLSKAFFLGSPHGIYGHDIYTGVNFYPSFKKANEPVTGFRLGADFFGNGIFLGAELQYLHSKNLDNLLFTPKAGIGFSLLYISYGYSITERKFPLDGIGRNTFALQVNLPFYTKDLLKNEVSWWPGGKKKKR